MDRGLQQEGQTGGDQIRPDIRGMSIISYTICTSISICIFQNKGAMMGCSNPHPHGQAWSLTEVPHIPSVELASLTKYSLNPDIPPSDAPRGPKGRPCMLCEYAHFEIGVAQDEGRIVVKNEDWVALVPWWATWPFEIMRKHAAATHRLLHLTSMTSQSSHTSAISHLSHILPRRRSLPLLLSSPLLPSATTTFSRALLHIPWEFINDLSPPRMVLKRNRTRRMWHIYTSTSSRRC